MLLALRDLLLRSVAGFGDPCTEDEVRDLPGVIDACRNAHTNLHTALQELCSMHCLQHDGGPRRSRRYWVGALSTAPADIPRSVVPLDTSVAAPRWPIYPSADSLVDRPTPIRAEGLEFRKHPSRRGDELHWPDGRITDLDGRLLRRRDSNVIALTG